MSNVEFVDLVVIVVFVALVWIGLALRSVRGAG